TLPHHLEEEGGERATGLMPALDQVLAEHLSEFGQVARPDLACPSCRERLQNGQDHQILFRVVPLQFVTELLELGEKPLEKIPGLVIPPCEYEQPGALEPKVGFDRGRRYIPILVYPCVLKCVAGSIQRFLVGPPPEEGVLEVEKVV